MEMIKGSKTPEATAYGDIHEDFIAQLNDLYVFDAAGVLTDKEQANLRFKVFDFQEYHQLGLTLFIVNTLKPAELAILKNFFEVNKESSALCVLAYSVSDSRLTVHYTEDLAFKQAMFENLNDQLSEDFPPQDHGQKVNFVIDEMGFMLMGHRSTSINWRLLLSLGVLFLVLSFFTTLFLPTQKKSNESLVLTLLRFMVLVSDKVMLLLAFFGVQARALGVLFFLPFALVGLLLQNATDLFSPAESLLASGLLLFFFSLVTIPVKASHKSKKPQSWFLQFLVDYPGNYYQSFMASFKADPMRFLGSIKVSNANSSSGSASSTQGQGGAFGGGGSSGRW